MRPELDASQTWWGTLRRVAALPKLRLMLIAAAVIFMAIAVINIQNRWGLTWGGFAGIVVMPLILVRLMRFGLGSNGGKHSRPG